MLYESKLYLAVKVLGIFASSLDVALSTLEWGQWDRCEVGQELDVKRSLCCMVTGSDRRQNFRDTDEQYVLKVFISI